MDDTRSLRLLLPAIALTAFIAIVIIVPRRERAAPSVSMHDASELDVPHVRSSFSPKNQGDDAQARYEYELMRLRDPLTGRIPPDIRTRELAFASTLPRVEQLAAKSGRAMAEQWSFRGPTNVGGRTRALAVDLDYDGNSNRRILAGGISGGMYLSEDDGQSWSLTTSLADLASVTCLAQDPSSHNVWYYGTGEFLGNSAGGGLQQFYGQGVFKSTDGGRTWAQLLSTKDGSVAAFDNVWDYVWNLAVHPEDGRVFAAVYGGVFRSTDAGNSWEYVLGRQSANDPFNSTTDVVIAADGDVYAALSRSGSGSPTFGVFKSTNLGDEWQNISPPGLTNDPYRMVLGPAPSDSNTLYLLVQTNQQGATAGDHQLFRYDDASGNWTDLTASIPNEQGVEGNASFSTQGGYDQIVRVKPDDANTVFVGGTNLYRSTNGGSSFARIGGYASPANYSQFDNHHSDQHSLAFLPTNPNVAISGSDGGVSRSNNILAQPHSWTSLNNGYVTTQFYTIALDPQPGGTSIIGGLQDNGTWGTQAPEGASAWTDLFGGDGAHAAVTPGATAFYVSSQNGNVYRLTGNSYAAITPAGGQSFTFINPFILDPNDPRVMYMGENGGLWRNGNLDEIPDGNQQPTSVNWTFLTASARQGLLTTTVAAARTPANRVYFGVTDFQSQSALVRVDNADSDGPGTDITPQISSQGFPPYPSFVAVNPDDGDEIIAVFSNYNIESVWHSTDAGGSWANVDGNLSGENGPSARTAAILPSSSGTLYFLGTSTGVYSSTALSGQQTTWALEGADVLGNVVVDMLVARPEDGTIVAATHGRGVYQATIGQGGAAAVATLDVNQLSISVRPNDTESVSFTITNTGTSDLSFNSAALGKTGTPAARYVLRPHERDARIAARPRDFNSTLAGREPGRADPGRLTASGQVPAAAGDFIILDDGTDFPDDFFGWGDGVTPFQWGSRFYATVGGFTLESFYVYMRSENELSLPIEAFITDPDGNVFVSGSLELPASADGTWYQIVFDPIPLPEGQAFDIELITPASIFYPAGVDANGQVPGVSFYWVNSGLDGFYTDLSSVDGFENGAWLIRAEGTAGGGSLNQPPTASIAASKTQVVVNESVTFDGSGSRDPDGSIVQYAWDLDDGTTSTEQMVQHSFAQPGVYTVTLTVTDNEGATGQASAVISVASDNQSPVARIQASKIQAEVNEDITFDGSGSSDSDGTIAQYSWAFGDGGSSSQAVVTHSYTDAGAYTVTLTVTDNEGSTGRATTQVNIISGPSRLSVSPLSGTLAPGESQTITVTYDATDQAAGTYSGQVTLTTNGGNHFLPVTINVDPSVDIEAGEDVPERFTLDQNYPNPFNPGTAIQFALDRPATVRLRVFDMSGREVRTLIDESKPSGSHTVTWDGRDGSGAHLASGTYVYRLEAFSETGLTVSTLTRKMVLLR